MGKGQSWHTVHTGPMKPSRDPLSPASQGSYCGFPRPASRIAKPQLAWFLSARPSCASLACLAYPWAWEVTEGQLWVPPAAPRAGPPGAQVAVRRGQGSQVQAWLVAPGVEEDVLWTP